MSALYPSPPRPGALPATLRLFDGAGNYAHKIIREGRVVGLELTLTGTAGIRAIINAVGLQLTADNPALRLHLFRPGAPDPLSVFPLRVAAGHGFAWHPLPAAAATLDTPAPQRYYLAYLEDELEGQAINRQLDLGARPCASCNPYNLEAWKTWSPHLAVRAFSTREAVPGPGSLTYHPGTNWGINLNLTLSADHHLSNPTR